MLDPMPRLLAAAAAALALAGTALAAGTGPAATLRVAEGSVRGAHFRPHERVRVVFDRTGIRRVRRVLTSASGSFRTPLVPFDPCVESLLITARGPAGEVARLKLPQRACPPSLGPQR